MTQIGDRGADDRLGTEHLNWFKALVENSSDLLGSCVTSESPRIAGKVSAAFGRLSRIEDSKLDIPEEALEKELHLVVLLCSSPFVPTTQTR